MTAPHRLRRKMPRSGVGLCLVLFGLFGPGLLRAQSADFTPAALDAWRASLSARLDRDLAELSATDQSPSRAPLDATQNGDQPPTHRFDPSSQFPKGRGEPWLPAVAAILRGHGLPGELLGVAAVESGFNPLALSPRGASGLWQLMPETARRYGLLVDSRRDERLDPVKSTYAAARYLKDLHAQFQDWPLALAAYNAGEERVERALERLDARDFWTLSRYAAVPHETRRYVPAVLARVAASLGPRSLSLLEAPIPKLAGSYAPTHADHSAARAHVVYALTSPAL